jgi:hypothetical protein
VSPADSSIPFDPFLIQLIRVVDSNNNEHCLEAIAPTASVSALSTRQSNYPTWQADGLPGRARYNSAAVCGPNARLVVRFGGIRDRKAEPLALVAASLHDSGWSLESIRPAGTTSRGKRQAHQFPGTPSSALAEYGVWAKRCS